MGQNPLDRIAQLLRGRERDQQPRDAEPEVDGLDQELENIMSRPVPDYFDVNYWETRYKKDAEPFEWYEPWARIRPVLAPVVPMRGRALCLGCGTSPLPSEMLKDGFEQVVAIDISPSAIQAMQQRFSDPRITWEVRDATSTGYEANSFDLVLDKGLIDGLCCGTGMTPSIAGVCSEASRLLRPGGFFVEVSYGVPSSRLLHLKAEKSFETLDPLTIVHDQATHYVYIGRKRA